MILFYFCVMLLLSFLSCLYLSFFFINCMIKYCCLFCWRPAVMALALLVAFRTLLTCLFIFVFGFCAENKFFFFFRSSKNSLGNSWIRIVIRISTEIEWFVARHPTPQKFSEVFIDNFSSCQ